MTEPKLPLSCPVFPLPNCVLFPKVLLPLRIFEPRYKVMLEQVLDSQGWMAVGMWQSPKREYDTAGNPDVFPVAGLGKLVNYQKAKDGTYKIVLIGEHRVMIKDWVQIKPYPIATLDRISELEPQDAQRDDIRGRLRERLRKLVGSSVDEQVLMLFEQSIKESEEIGPLVDSIGYHFLSDPFEKQALLEIAHAVEREEKLIRALQKQRFGDEDDPQM